MNKWRIVLLTVWLMMFSSEFAFAEKAAVESVTITSASGATRLQILLNQAVSPHIFLLSKPDRLVVDFEQDTQLKAKLAELQLDNPNIKIVRSGHPKPNVLRLVVEMKTPLKTFKVIPQPEATCVVIDLVSLSTVKNALKITSQRAPVIAVPKKAASGEPLPIQLGSSTVMLPPKRPIVIVIDPGHGGKDPGAIGILGTKEKDVVLAISQQLAQLLNQQPRIRAVLTRQGDYFVSLRKRLKLAREGKADLFVAIHADSYFNKNSHGVSVYALSQRGATSEAARWLAKRDNDSELGGVDLSELEDQSYLLRSVLIDLAQTATTTDSLRLGGVVLDALYPVAKLHYQQVEQAPFVVLKSPDIPSVLVETGFISNLNEELRLRSKEYRNKIARALFEGIHQYAKKYL